MQILLEPSAGHYRNAGDVAMLHAAYRRFREFWPDAAIHVISGEPGELVQVCPGAIPIDMGARNALFHGPSVSGKLRPLLPPSVSVPLHEFERSSQQRFPAWGLSFVKWKHPDLLPAAENYLRVLHASDLVAATGAGQLTDAFAYPAGMMLNTLRIAVRRKIPVVMLGQGIGPISDAPLLARCRRVLPRVSFISLREDRTGPAILRALGVSPGRILITGDDAIETAYEQRPPQLGRALGINAREASYAATGSAHAAWLRRVVRDSTRELDAPLAGIPISRNPGESDIDMIGHILDGFRDVLMPDERSSALESAIQQAGACRVVLTASYHGAVFALSQGISVIGLANSSYYTAKFEGLAGQFGSGCRHVVLDHPRAPEALREAIREAWHAAPQARPTLLAAAARQIELGRKAYRRIYDELNHVHTRSHANCSVG